MWNDPTEGKAVTQSAVPIVVQVILAILGVAVTVLGGMFMFLWSGIVKLRDDMSVSIDARAAEHRQGQQQLWSELRLADARANEYRARVEGRLGELPTRTEMKQARDEMREDLKAMEDRIRKTISADPHRV